LLSDGDDVCVISDEAGQSIGQNSATAQHFEGTIYCCLFTAVIDVDPGGW